MLGWYFLCPEEVETVNHTGFECFMAQQVWTLLMFSYPLQASMVLSRRACFTYRNVKTNRYPRRNQTSDTLDSMDIMKEQKQMFIGRCQISVRK
ncbi:hypothetical protein HID58_009348 [Brassica napus]|uniref:Uncharacterized protein n=1 Tax=Brassica napus TaxID=3708 RepID=A0ABQ8DSB1_BRANA|nr:hypothetical protein HID58_009348 [Brassica napus]